MTCAWQAGDPLTQEMTQTATDADLRLAVHAIGPLARYGNFINAALAGIYAERHRAAANSRSETPPQPVIGVPDEQ